MIKTAITIKAFAVLVLSAVIATQSFAQIKKNPTVTPPGASSNKVTTANLLPGQTFRDCFECPEQ